ncbi:transmembrane protein 121B-like [Branchiostoma lanceolatum]|uniref:transmembrane protein 121B-like n=1 Tax=Branchiostoma lanceolatum TaxID=7740 RepID=UPI003455703E
MGKVTNLICARFGNIPARVMCVLVLVCQGALLDYCLAFYLNLNWLGWIAADVVVVCLWLYALITSYRYFRQTWMSPGAARTRDELPFAFISWFVYACLYVPRVAIIFKWEIAAKLIDHDWFGPNALKTTLALSAPLFLLLLYGHHDAKPHSNRKNYVDRLALGVTFDILDSLELLDILFVEESRVILTFDLENAILSFACIVFFLPTVALFELRKNRSDGEVASVNFGVLYSLLFMLLVNIPFLVIRLLLWNIYNQDVSVFLIKNVMLLIMGFKDIWENLGPHGPRKCSECDGTFHPDQIEPHKEKCAPEEAMELQDGGAESEASKLPIEAHSSV